MYREIDIYVSGVVIVDSRLGERVHANEPLYENSFLISSFGISIRLWRIVEKKGTHVRYRKYAIRRTIVNNAIRVPYFVVFKSKTPAARATSTTTSRDVIARVSTSVSGEK